MRIAICLTVVGLSLATAQTPLNQAPEWRLTRPVSDAEKASVLALAAKLNIYQAALITDQLILQPLGCEALRIESVVATAGQRRTWRRVWVTSTEWPDGCSRMKQPDATSSGSWVVATEAQDIGAWRLQTRDGVQDVETPPTIPYDAVVAIVDAVRNGRLVDRMPYGTRVPLRPIPKVDAKSIVVVWTDHFDPSLFVVRFRGVNAVFQVAVRGTRVELRTWWREYA
jgi:hypothetical protein